MLFDLRGRGRRRSIQVIYLTLAVLMGGGLVLFGIGGNTNGGLVDALTGGSGSPDTGIFGERVEAAEKQVMANRKDAAAWAALARASYQEASSGSGFDQTTGAFNEDGKDSLRKADNAWKQYLALDPPTPDPNVAILMTQAYGAGGLNKLSDAVAAQELVADAREDVGSYLQLAAFAYEAGQSRKGELAGEKAVDLATKDQKEQVKAQVEGLKSQAAQAAAEAIPGGTAPGGAPATGTTP